MTLNLQRDKCWFRTFSGKVIDPENLKPEDIDPIDIARSLSLQCRYGGQIVRFYSVAEHCLNVMTDVKLSTPNLKHPSNKDVILGALLHDASEAYMCDIPTPFKKLLPQYMELEAKVMQVVHKRFNLNLDSFETKIINDCDKGALIYEMPQVFNYQDDAAYDYDLYDKLDFYTPDQAFSLFLNTLLRLERGEI